MTTGPKPSKDLSNQDEANLSIPTISFVPKTRGNGLAMLIHHLYGDREDKRPENGSNISHFAFECSNVTSVSSSFLLAFVYHYCILHSLHLTYSRIHHHLSSPLSPRSLIAIFFLDDQYNRVNRSGSGDTCQSDRVERTKDPSDSYRSTCLAPQQ